MFENAKLIVEFREFFAVWQSNILDRCRSRTELKSARHLKVAGGKMGNYEQLRPNRDSLFTQCEGEENPRNEEARAFKESSIPRRYREGHDRINLERVRGDQRRARCEFVLALIRSLK